MRDYIEIGPSPCGESCVQLGEENYPTRARAECNRFIQLIREVLGTEPSGARLAVKGHPHDFGTYYEVICYYDPENQAALEYAFRCESDSPETWE